MLPGNFDKLVSYFGFCAYVFYTICVLAMMWLRYKKPHLDRPFRVRPYPVLPIMYDVTVTHYWSGVDDCAASFS